MALDEQRETDHVYRNNGITFVMDSTLLEDAKPVTVDYLENEYGAGYNVTSNLPKAGGCGGSCSTC